MQNPIEEKLRFKLKGIWRAKSKGIRFMSFALLVFATLSILYNFLGESTILTLYHENFWGHIIDPVFSIVTGILAFYIYVSDAYNNWKNSLDKRISIDYIYDEKTVMQIHQAYLADEADIRNWSQQLGKQLCGQDLKFDLALEKVDSQSGIYPTEDNKEFFVHFSMVMYLHEDPRHDFFLETMTEKTAEQKNEMAKKRINPKLKSEELTYSKIERKSQNSIWTWKRTSKNTQ